MRRASARLWKEAGHWVVQIEIDGQPYTERDYADIATATQAIAQVLRNTLNAPTTSTKKHARSATSRWTW